MKILIILLCILVSGCSASQPEQSSTSAARAVTEAYPTETIPPTKTLADETTSPDPIGEIIATMSLEEQVGQLFLARCDDSIAIADIQNYHLGGFVLFGVDFSGQTPDSIAKKLQSYQAAADIPLLLSVDEEGGTVNRVSREAFFRSTPFPSLRESYNGGGRDQVLAIEEEKCLLLHSLGLNVNLGPVCDISTDSGAFMYQRSLGQDATTTGSVISGIVNLMSAHQIGSVLKHFPGYGDNADTHTGIAVDSRSLAQLEACDLIPFAEGFKAGADAVMVSHTIVEAIDTSLPASLSPSVIRYLREDMGFTGVIITDDLAMEAITDQYGAGEAAVLAILAGNDLLCATDYRTQYNAVLAAVLDGRIESNILNNAVRNVLEWKMELGLI